MLKIEYFRKIIFIGSLLLLSATLVYAEDSDSYYLSTTFNAGFSDMDNIKMSHRLTEAQELLRMRI